MKLIAALINSNIYISLGAVFLTIETQIQLGMTPQWHPYLFIIFFATLFEYNIHRLVTIVTNKEALNSDKHKWVRKNLTGFYLLVFLSVAGFTCVAFLAKREVLITLAPIAVITLFYSLPVFGNKRTIFRLREIPYLKIFLIAFVWASSTILLPIIQSGNTFNRSHVVAMLAERFFFVLAITIPFDVRDIEADKQAGLKTIPLLLNEDKSLVLSYLSLFIFFLISFFHYQMLNRWFIILPLSISTLTTFLFLNSKKIKNLPYYHYGILDGTMFLQGLLVLVFYYLNVNFNK
ncbi:MAG TPA: UbiA family prenyltransferase [Bacteroidia bacterium]|nr:UbiA family prenyltransferase [Bacteroidia bacterium]